MCIHSEISKQLRLIDERVMELFNDPNIGLYQISEELNDIIPLLLMHINILKVIIVFL